MAPHQHRDKLIFFFMCHWWKQCKHSIFQTVLVCNENPILIHDDRFLVLFVFLLLLLLKGRFFFFGSSPSTVTL